MRGVHGEGPQVGDCHQAALGRDHPATLRITTRVASALRELGALAEARDLYADVLSRARRVLGENHPLTRSAAKGAYDS